MASANPPRYPRPKKEKKGYNSYRPLLTSEDPRSYRHMNYGAALASRKDVPITLPQINFCKPK